YLAGLCLELTVNSSSDVRFGVVRLDPLCDLRDSDTNSDEPRMERIETEEPV
ncbi:uncharacterized protein B0T23DRAFT_295381, partial [Neurospora hispaniola]